MSRITNFNTVLADERGQVSGAAALALAHNHQQLLEIMREARAANVQMQLSALVAAVPGTGSVVQIAQAADVTNFITITAVGIGAPAAGNILTIAIAPNGADALAVTFSAGGVLSILLANVTNANNTLTLIKAALDAVSLGRYSTAITGTASTQMLGTNASNTYAAAAPGAAAGTGVKSSVAGTAAVAASRTLSIATI